jgi:predicted MarR family transcription regulator
MKRHETAAVPAGPILRLGARAPASAPTEHLHLVADRHAAALTRLELGVMRAQEAFASWAVELNKHVAGEQLSYQDVALLHSVRLRGGTPTLTDMLIFLHRHDLAALQYSFRKLEKHGLVRRSRGAMRREITYDVTDKGRHLTDAYARLRHEVLVKLVGGIMDMDESMHAAAAVLERMVGIYDQATQSILNEHLLAQSSAYTAAPPATAARTSNAAPARKGNGSARPRPEK